MFSSQGVIFVPRGLSHMEFSFQIDGNLQGINQACYMVAIAGVIILVLSHSCQVIAAHFDGLVQERRNSSVLAMEFRLSCTSPSICRLSTHRWNLVDSNPALVRKMGAKSLSEPMMAYFTDAFMCHSASVS